MKMLITQTVHNFDILSYRYRISHWNRVLCSENVIPVYLTLYKTQLIYDLSLRLLWCLSILIVMYQCLLLRLSRRLNKHYSIGNYLNKEDKIISYYESTLEVVRISYNNSTKLVTSYISIIIRKYFNSFMRLFLRLSRYLNKPYGNS